MAPFSSRLSLTSENQAPIIDRRSRNSLCTSCSSALLDPTHKLGKKYPFRSRPWRRIPTDSKGRQCQLCHFLASYISTADLLELQRAFDDDTANTKADGLTIMIEKVEDESDDPAVNIYRVCITNQRLSRYRNVAASKALEFPTFEIHEYGTVDPSTRPTSGACDVVSTASMPTLRTAQMWIQQCDETHSLCKIPAIPNRHSSASADAWHPTRLLHVTNFDTGRDSYEIQLKEDQFPRDLQYIALSYCWGPEAKFFRLLGSNLTSLKERVPFDNLPATLRDAIRTTAALGLRYIWIDALCIIQDNQDDWAREAAAMSRIYTFAYLNIAAAAGATCQDGLFRDRDEEALNGIPINVRWKGIVHPANTHHLVRGNHFNLQVESSPLSNRGWVLQERLLSRRTLFYGEDQIFWECLQQRLSEAHPKGGPWKMSGSGEDDGWTKRRFALALSNTPDQEHSNLTSTLWEQLVENYAQRKLTFQSDKLVAIDGIAQRMRSSLNDDNYCFGMWVRDLPCSLLWMVLHGGTRPDQYRAPSWSWASVDGEISHFPMVRQAVAEVVELRHHDRDGSRPAPDSRVPKATCASSFKSPVTVKVKGRLCRAKWKPSTRFTGAGNLKDLEFATGRVQPTWLAHPCSDIPNTVAPKGSRSRSRQHRKQQQEKKEVFCLEMAHAEPDFGLRDLSIEGLVLEHIGTTTSTSDKHNLQGDQQQQPAPRGGQFRRVGYFRVQSYRSKRMLALMAGKTLPLAGPMMSKDWLLSRCAWKVLDRALDTARLEEEFYIERDAGDGRYTIEIV